MNICLQILRNSKDVAGIFSVVSYTIHDLVCRSSSCGKGILNLANAVLEIQPEQDNENGRINAEE